MSDTAVPEPVYFLPGQIDEAVALLHAWPTHPDEIDRSIEIAPVDLPDALLPEVSGFLGRKKRTGRPTVQILYLDPGQGGGESTISVDATDRLVGDALRMAGVTAPAGADLQGNKNAVMVLADVGADAASIVRFAVDALVALAPGWEPRFRASALAL